MPRHTPLAIPAILAACALACCSTPACADPFDRCGVFVEGLEGCIVFQTDGDAQRVRPDISPPPAVGARGRLQGDLTQCVSFCSVPCVNGAVLTPCAAPPACAPDFDVSGSLTPNDIFAFLNAWFAGMASADFDHSGTLAAQDIFDFINAWFAGC